MRSTDLSSSIKLGGTMAAAATALFSGITVLAAEGDTASTNMANNPPSGNGGGQNMQGAGGPGASGGAPAGQEPSGNAPGGNANAQGASTPSGNPPQMPGNDPSNGNSGEAPSGAPDGNAAPGGAPGAGGPGGQSAVTEWTAVTTFTTDTSEGSATYTSTGTDENAILVQNGATVTLENPTVTRISADSTGGDSSSFYGVGAAILTTDGTTNINGGNITTDAAGGAGVFSYDNGVTYVKDTVINTTQNTSGGIHVAGGGQLYAENVTATTQGESSAAIRSDRGGGTMVVNGGTYTSNGSGSPAVYVTADISINDATLTANGSEGICIEGLNTLRLFDCDLTSQMPDLEQNDCTWSVILYQSMSGDSEVGNSSYYQIGGSLNSTNGGLFYSTNTESDFYLENVTITAADDQEFFLKVTGNSNQRGWGSTGSNGADTDFTAVAQICEGDVIWDSISNLDMYLTQSSSLTGAVIDDETSAGNGGDGYAALYIDDSSSWIVTGDSTVTNLYSEGEITDASGNTVTILSQDGTTYVEGTSEYTITVDTYSQEVDLSGVLTGVSWEDYDELPLAGTQDGSNASSEKATLSMAGDGSNGDALADSAQNPMDSAAAQVSAQTSTSASETSTASTLSNASTMSTGVVLGIAAVIAAAFGGIMFFLKKKR